MNTKKQLFLFFLAIPCFAFSSDSIHLTGKRTRNAREENPISIVAQPKPDELSGLDLLADAAADKNRADQDRINIAIEHKTNLILLFAKDIKLSPKDLRNPKNPLAARQNYKFTSEQQEALLVGENLWRIAGIGMDSFYLNLPISRATISRWKGLERIKK